LYPEELFNTVALFAQFNELVPTHSDSITMTISGRLFADAQRPLPGTVVACHVGAITSHMAREVRAQAGLAEHEIR
jgi:hypothetical protein